MYIHIYIYIYIRIIYTYTYMDIICRYTYHMYVYIYIYGKRSMCMYINVCVLYVCMYKRLYGHNDAFTTMSFEKKKRDCRAIDVRF